MKSILLKSSLLAISLAGSGTGMGIVFSTAVGTLLKLISSYVVTTLGPLGDVVTGQSLQLLYFTYDWHSFVFVTIICPLIVLTIILWF
jgi:hypothetical protein